jgi:adenosylcobyric acid synthase
VFAALFGTVALLEPADQALISGFVVNKFRGDGRLLAPGLEMITGLTGRPVLGVLPWLEGLWLDVEDSLAMAAGPPAALPPAAGDDVLRIAVVRLPRISNATDCDPLIAEPGVLVRFVTRPEELADADLVVLPGSRSTVADLRWLREQGLADAVRRRAAEDRPVLGICAGFQMLARTIEDEVESGAGLVDGLGLLPARVRFGPGKVLARPRGQALGQPVEGYQIHHGVAVPEGGEPFLDGCTVGSVSGTSWHGIFENDGFRQAFLTGLAARTGRRRTPSGVSFAAVRERRLDALGDLVAEHLDTAALLRLIEHGAPAGLPVVPPGAPATQGVST